MSDLDALLAGIVENPHEGLRWLVLADWLDDHGQPERAELTRLHRELLRTCSEPDKYPERPAIHERIMELMRAGATPCVPRMTLQLPGGVELPTVFIPPGSFRMGSPEDEWGRSDDEHLHIVRLTEGFFFGVSPVTQSQWVAIMGENPSQLESNNLPVDNVSWDDIEAFCEKLIALCGQWVRLPTEAEWEYACRSGTETPFYWGYELKGTEANCDGTEPYISDSGGSYLGSTTPIGNYQMQSPHPWGLQDCHGNILEACSDWYHHYFYWHSPMQDPLNVFDSGFGHVSRGGSYLMEPRLCRAAARYPADSPGGNMHGFRIAVTPLN